MPLPSTWSALEVDLNTLESSLLTQLHALQPPFLAAHGHYFQGIRTSDYLPVDGELVVPNTRNNPYYQQDDWETLGIVFPSVIPCTVAVFQLSGPKGNDWQLRMGLELDGVKWVKFTAGLGTEADSSGDWVSILADPTIDPHIPCHNIPGDV